MILARKVARVPKEGEFCTLNKNIRRELSLLSTPINDFFRLKQNKIISNSSQITKARKLGIENCDVFLVTPKKSPFSNSLLTITPVIVEQDIYGFGMHHVMKNNIEFLVNPDTISIFTGDVRAMNSEVVNDSFSTKVMDYINTVSWT